jgi:hypothetical protein
VVVDDLDVVGVIVPDEANPVLGIHPDALLSSPVACERFEAIGGRRAKIFQAPRLIEHLQLTQRHPFNALEEPAARPAVPQGFCIPTAKRADH